MYVDNTIFEFVFTIILLIGYSLVYFLFNVVNGRVDKSISEIRELSEESKYLSLEQKSLKQRLKK